jgi:hypothetical protein
MSRWSHSLFGLLDAVAGFWERTTSSRRCCRSGSPTTGSTDPLGQGHDDPLRSAPVGHAPDVLVLTDAADRGLAVCGQPVDGGL